MFLICERCQTDFEGRANRQYCSTACKSAVNNERQYVKTKDLIHINKTLRANRRIMADLYELFGEQPFDRQLLDRKGLDSKRTTGSTDRSLLFYEYVLSQNNQGLFFITKN
jgi:hypothetical protein